MTNDLASVVDCDGPQPSAEDLFRGMSAALGAVTMVIQ